MYRRSGFRSGRDQVAHPEALGRRARTLDAFPRLNLLSWYLYVLGAGYGLIAMLAGGLDTGWTFYTPYTTQYSNYNVSHALLGVIIIGFSSMLKGEKPQSSVEPSRSFGMKLAARTSASAISCGLSTRGFCGLTTPM